MLRSRKPAAFHFGGKLCAFSFIHSSRSPVLPRIRALPVNRLNSQLHPRNVLKLVINMKHATSNTYLTVPAIRFSAASRTAILRLPDIPFECRLSVRA